MKISPYLQEMIDGLVVSDASLRLRHANGNATFSITSKHKSVCEKIANTFEKIPNIFEKIPKNL